MFILKKLNDLKKWQKDYSKSKEKEKLLPNEV